MSDDRYAVLLRSLINPTQTNLGFLFFINSIFLLTIQQIITMALVTNEENTFNWRCKNSFNRSLNRIEIRNKCCENLFLNYGPAKDPFLFNAYCCTFANHMNNLKRMNDIFFFEQNWLQSEIRCREMCIFMPNSIAFEI